MALTNLLFVHLHTYNKWLSPIMTRYYSNHIKTSIIPKDQIAAYQNSLPSIMDKAFKENITAPEVVDRIKKITEYNTIGGKKIRGHLVLSMYGELMKPHIVTEKSLQHVHALAWGVEMLHSYFMILDDIFDNAKMRRGKTCWYLLPDVNLRALNDASLLRSFIYEILKCNFADESSYINILHQFNKAFLNTSIGQDLDNTTVKTKERGLDNFNMEQYNTICEYKTTYYTFKLPIYLALELANKKNKDSFQYLDSICDDIGKLRQIQNDYSECYGQDVSVYHSLDIQEGKCTWLAVEALQRCTPAQRIVFTACYGSKEPAHIERVKRLYDELHLPALYREQERALCHKIIQKSYTGDIVPPEFFKHLLEFIHE